AIVGQQVSVATANTLFERIVTRYGKPFAVPQAPAELKYVFPQPSVLSGADLTEVGVIRSRAVAISRLAQTVVQNPDFFNQLTTLDSSVKTLCQLRGIGPWTAHYIAMRALQAPDAFPPGDIGLLRGIAALGEPLTKSQLQERSTRWQPWRTYAAMQLWAVDSQSRANPSIPSSSLEALTA
ncbi:MAG: DNA-3-methyladenine glycosylase 2 family protein, partial [Cyanobacteria bacterium J06555_12]